MVNASRVQIDQGQGLKEAVNDSGSNVGHSTVSSKVGQGRRISGRKKRSRKYVMGKAVHKSPSVSVKVCGSNLNFLVDTGSMVTTLTESAYHTYIEPYLNLDSIEWFKLNAVNNVEVPCLGYLEADVTCMGDIVIPKVGIIVLKDSCKNSNQDVPGILGCNFFNAAVEHLSSEYGTDFLSNPNLSIPSTWKCFLSIFHGQGTKSEADIHVKQTAVKEVGDGLLSRASVVINHKPICIPGRSAYTVLASCTGVKNGTKVLVEPLTGDLNHMNSNLVLNRVYATVQANKVPIALINTSDSNIWIRNKIPVANLYDVEVCKPEVEVNITSNRLCVDQLDICVQSTYPDLQGESDVPLVEECDNSSISQGDGESKLPFDIDIGSGRLTNEQREQLFAVLEKHK